MRLRLTLTLIGLLAVFGLLWAMWPSPISPAYWDEPRPPDMTGPLEPNDALASATVIPVGEPGTAEGVAVAPTGEVYFGTVDGRIQRLTPTGPDDDPVIEEIARVNETPVLGLEWLQPGVLGVAAISGLYVLDVDSRTFDLVSAGALAYPFGYVNDLAVAPDGRIYFTDSSTRWGHSSNNAGYVYDMLENRPSGALYVWDPRTRQTRLVHTRLHYPNGIELSPDGRSLLVAESFRYRILRIWIDGPQTGQIDVFADNLPGMPDGIEYDGDGRLLVVMSSPRVPLLAFLHRHPRIAQLLMKLPEWLRPSGGPSRAFVLVLDAATGEALDSFHDPDGELCYISNLALTADDTLWFGSTDCGHLGRYALPPLPPATTTAAAVGTAGMPARF